MSVYDSILQGLNKALAYLEVQADTNVTPQGHVLSVYVAVIRTRTGLSQVQFARSIGVAKGPLLN